MAKVFLLLGSNTGERKEILLKAMDLIEDRVGKISQKSGLYETEPWGLQEQSFFLNQMVLVNSDLNAFEILQNILAIELQLGRKREEKWGARTIDIDIIYFNSEIIVTPQLKVPHPEIQNRMFTLIPLCELAKDFIHPVFNISSEEMLNRCSDPLLVKRINSTQISQ